MKICSPLLIIAYFQRHNILIIKDRIHTVGFYQILNKCFIIPVIFI